MASLLLHAYRAATFAAAPLAGPLLSIRLNKRKEDPERLGERRGQAEIPRPAGALVWLHGASVGETMSLAPLVERLTHSGVSALVTSGTVTSARLMAERLPPRALHQFAPLDSPLFCRRFFRHWRPDLGLVAESEIWPNMIVEACLAGTPLAMVNARMSERSYSRWRRAPALARDLLGRFELALAQTEADAARFLRLGARAAHSVGNLKFDAPAPPADRRELAALSGLLSGRRLWVAASTHPGEEDMLARAQALLAERFPDLLLIMAPRHPERGAEIAEALGAEIDGVRLRSRGEIPDRNTQIYVCDTMGEMGLFYRLCDIVFLGKSLHGRGGQNPIEPAKLASAILHGPHVGNFAEVYAALDEEGGAACVRDETELAERLGDLLADPRKVRRMAGAAAAVVERSGGAVERSLIALAPWLPDPIS